MRSLGVEPSVPAGLLGTLKSAPGWRSLGPVHCHACDQGSELDSGERIGFRDTCERCGADLHVCCNCRHHDPSAYNECNESNAERVDQRARANRCDYFTPGEQRGGGGGSERATAQDRLEKLFRK